MLSTIKKDIENKQKAFDKKWELKTAENGQTYHVMRNGKTRPIRLENNGKWFRVDHYTLFMRKCYRFRMIGSVLYCAPKV